MDPSCRSMAAVLVLLIGCVAVGVGLKGRQDDADETKSTNSKVVAPVPAEVDLVADPAVEGEPEASSAKRDPRFERLADGRSLVTEAVETARGMHAAGAVPQSDLEAIDAIFGLYRWAYQEVPEGGDNRELVAALMGENPKKLVFIPGDHPGLNPSGELVDRWGTPYFFHKISDQVIDVTSAGPDRRLWSRDDLTLGHTETYQAASSR